MTQSSNELPAYVLEDLPRQVSAALDEDRGCGDITAELIPADAVSSGRILCREAAVICGSPWVEEVFRQLPGEIDITWKIDEGEPVKADTVLCEILGNSRKILTGERTALNFLQLLSGTATVARQYARAAEGANITVLDTRKTVPGLRTAQKYAVLCGGCENHRIGLYDQFLIKENHIAACGGINEAVEKARSIAADRTIVVEVESLDEVAEAIAARPDRIMLDDFDTPMTDEALRLIPETINIEISGNQTLASIGNRRFPRAVFLSVGAITKNVQAIDLSLRLDA